MTEKENWDDHILSNLTDADFELPNLDWVDEDEEDGDGLKTKEIKEVVVEESGKDKLDDTILSTPSASHSTREVLILLDNDRKKIITLQEGEFYQIEQKLLESLEGDPIFKKSVRKSHIVFQEYNTKFNTWVDFDKSKEICDGAHLKAIFIPKPKEESSSHHKSRHKEKKHKRKRSSDRDSRSRSSSRTHRSYKHQKSDHGSENDDTQLVLHPSIDANMAKTEDLCSSSEPNMTVICKEVNDSTFLETSHTADSKHTQAGNSVINKHSSDCSLPTSTTSRTHSELPRFSAAEAPDIARTSASSELTTREKKPHTDLLPQRIVLILSRCMSHNNSDSVQNCLLTGPNGKLYFLSLALKGKTPVTALHELCQKLKWGSPEFSLVTESYFPGHSPGFLMKVTIKGESFVPDSPSNKKKLAKNAAAECALKSLGIFN
ncbi:uncharacterized protein [Anabrus simplex]|uniref:uncharacterized protein isoform X1 n=1 Tax=Anabrus simplex TaxID=316456 RepID=UPI0035A3396E